MSAATDICVGFDSPSAALGEMAARAVVVNYGVDCIEFVFPDDSIAVFSGRFRQEWRIDFYEKVTQ